MCFGISSYDEFRPLIAIEEQAFLGAEVPFVWPDLIVIYDVSADVARERMGIQGKELDEFEKDVSFQSRVRHNYLEFAKRYPNCHIIDGSGTPEKVLGATKKVVFPLLGLSE